MTANLGKRVKDITGIKFGSLTAIEFAHVHNMQAYWKFQCDEWKNNPEAFVKWSIENGWSKGLHIDKDILCKAKGIYPHIYSPNTCQWVKPQVNVSEASNRTNYGKHPNIRLSQEQVDEIIKLYNSDEKITYTELAKMYGLKSPSSIARLIKLANKEAD